jgi:hypothetical protein
MPKAKRDFRRWETCHFLEFLPLLKAKFSCILAFRFIAATGQRLKLKRDAFNFTGSSEWIWYPSQPHPDRIWYTHQAYEEYTRSEEEANEKGKTTVNT